VRLSGRVVVGRHAVGRVIAGHSWSGRGRRLHADAPPTDSRWRRSRHGAIARGRRCTDIRIGDQSPLTRRTTCRFDNMLARVRCERVVFAIADFDMLRGHRNEFEATRAAGGTDRRIPEPMCRQVTFSLCADHGCDHDVFNRSQPWYVPLWRSSRGRGRCDLGTRPTLHVVSGIDFTVSAPVREHRPGPGGRT
jgi:hypothetical protein